MPGELEGICVKMIQKDPKFRYPSCEMVAEALDAWRAKYLAELKRTAKVGPAGAGSDSRLNLGEESGVGTGRLPASSIDTVSNRTGDTKAGKSGSGNSQLSAGDSGILMRIAKRAETEEESSRIDLEAEIRRRAAQSTAHGQGSASGVSKSSPSAAKSSPANKPATPSKPVTKPTAKINQPVALPKSRGKLAAVIIALLIMAVLAVALGLFIFYRIAQ